MTLCAGRIARALGGAAIACVVACAVGPVADRQLSGLPAAEAWIHHFERDLLPGHELERVAFRDLR